MIADRLASGVPTSRLIARETMSRMANSAPVATSSRNSRSSVVVSSRDRCGIVMMRYQGFFTPAKRMAFQDVSACVDPVTSGARRDPSPVRFAVVRIRHASGLAARSGFPTNLLSVDMATMPPSETTVIIAPTGISIAPSASAIASSLMSTASAPTTLPSLSSGLAKEVTSVGSPFSASIACGSSR